MKSARHAHRHLQRHAPAYLPRLHKLAIYLILAVTWGSGVGWLVCHNFLKRHGPFGPEPNPFEAWWLTLHGAGAFACLWLAGWLWSRHVTPWWHSDRRRPSGLALIGLGTALIVTGYLLYYASGDRLRQAISLLHWTIGLALVVPVIVHAVRSQHHRRGHRGERSAISRSSRGT